MALQRMYPIAHFCSWTLPTGYGSHTAPGASTSVESGDCSPYCDDLVGARDQMWYGMARSSATAGTRNNGRAEFTFADPPQNVVIVSVKLVAWVRTSNAGAAIIDSTPTLKMFNFVSGGARVYEPGTQSITKAVNRNTESPLNSWQKVEYTWTAKPGGGAWTRAELLSGLFKAGFESSAASGNGSGIDATTGGSSASLDWDSVYLELETTPTALYIDPVRQANSHQLRMLRRALRPFTLEVPLEFGQVEPGETVWSSHDLLPWAPGLRSWEQVPLYCLGVDDLVQVRRRRLRFLDLRDQYAAFWSPLQITGVDAQNSGLAMVHRGGSWATARAQVAYAQRPGDGLYQAVASGAPCLTKDGLLIQGGGTPTEDTNHIVNSTFSQGAGDTFTGWTKFLTGAATIVQDLADFLVDVAGLQRSAKLTAAAGEICRPGVSTATLTAGTKVYVRIKYKNDSGSSTMGWQLVRSAGATTYWDDSAGAWVAGATVNPLALSTTIAHGLSKQIDVGASNVTLFISPGYQSPAGAVVGHLYSVEIVTGTQAEWGQRDLLPTTTATVARVKDLTTLDNSASFRVWNPSRGYFRVDVRPNWNHTDLDDGDNKVVLAGAHDGAVGAAGMHQVCVYHRTTSTSGYWELNGARWNTVGGTGDPTLPLAGRWYTIAGRWTSSAEDEQDLPGQAYSIWVDGVKGSVESTGNTEPGTPTTAAVVYLGADPTFAGSSWFDGVLKNLVIDSWCPTDDEMSRM